MNPSCGGWRTPCATAWTPAEPFEEKMQGLTKKLEE
jgi:hypothetical protein